MKVFFLYLLCLLLCFKAQAQQDAEGLRMQMKATNPYPQRIAACIAYNEKYGLQNFDSLLRNAEEGMALARANKDSFSVGVLKRQMGEAWYFKGKYDLAAAHFYTSIDLLRKEEPTKQLANTYNALAKLYRKTRDLSRSLQNYDEALSIFRQLKDSSGMATIWNESGVVFEYAKDYPKAIERYNTSLQIDGLLNDTVGIAYALSNLAGVYILQGNYALAKQNLLQALAVRKQLRDSFALALNYSDLGSAVLASPAYANAKTYIDTSNLIAAKMGYPELMQTNFDLLSQWAAKSGDYKNAYQYAAKKAALKDSIFNIEKAKEIEALNTRYETAEKEKQITEQRQKIQRQNIVFIGIAAAVLLLSLLAYTQYRRYKWKQEARLQTEILKQQQATTKAVLEAEETERQRIAKDLHDGVGQMMSAAKMNLSAYEHAAEFGNTAQKQKFEKIIQLVDESCNEVRSVSHNMMPNALLKNSLAAAIREFINKLDSRQLAVHLYTEGLEDRLDRNVETVLYRVIQECVNNVVKHSGAGKLDISIIKDEEGLTATVEDNGRGFDATKTQESEGIGLKNIRTRIDYLKGTVEFDSSPGRGTLVAVHVPL